jgi:MFS transporter, UMF1 family
MNKVIPAAGKKEIFSWCCYDFANSSFTTVIITVIYSTYFTSVVCGNMGYANTLWAAALAVSQLIVILFGPWFGAFADKHACKKEFLTGLAILCSGFTALLYFTAPGTVWLAFALIVAGNFAFSLGENFCASFLPEISTPETCGKISGYGWSFGYLGGLVSLGLALLILKIGGDSSPEVVRNIFPATGLFFVLAALPTLLFLRERAQPKSAIGKDEPSAMSHLLGTLKKLPSNRTLLQFFVSFFFYMCGLCAIVAFAAIYAQKELGFTTKTTIMLFASLQISSAVGAFTFGFFQDRFGAKPALVLSLLLWVLVCLGAALAQTQMIFFLVGNAAGVVIGSTQSASRAVVSMLTPKGQEGEYFGLWGFFGKLAAVAGPFAFGLVADVVHLRWAIGLVAVFFIMGILAMSRLQLKRSKPAS